MKGPALDLRRREAEALPLVSTPCCHLRLWRPRALRLVLAFAMFRPRVGSCAVFRSVCPGPAACHYAVNADFVFGALRVWPLFCCVFLAN